MHIQKLQGWLFKPQALAKSLLVIFCLVALYGVLPAHRAEAVINRQINFQGKIVLSSNSTNITNGTYNMQFKIYSGGDGVPGGGDETLLWTEDRLRNASQGVSITDGIFQVNLGAVTALPGSVDFNNSTLWLSINLGNTNASCTPFSSCSGDGEMNPMVRFTAAPYSFNTDLFDGLDSNAFGQLTQNQTWTGTQTFQPTTNITSAIVRQTSVGSPTADIFNVQTANSTNVLQVTGPTANEAAVTLQSVGATRSLTLDSGSGNLVLGTNTTTILKSGTALTIDANNGSNSTVTVTNGGAGVASLSVEGNVTAQGGTITLGNNTSQAGTLVLFDGSGNTSVSLTASGVGTGYSLTLPTAAGGTSQCLQTDSVTASQLIFSTCSSGGGDNITVNGSAADNANFLSTSASASVAGVAFTLNAGSNPDDITIAISDASATVAGVITANAQVIAGLKTFNNGIALAANQTISMAGGTTASRPGSPTEGMVYFDTDTDRLLVYTNSKWQADRSGAVLVAASNSTQAAKDAADYVANGEAVPGIGTIDGDQVQIQDALNDADPAGAGRKTGKVFLFPGTYTVDANIAVPDNTILAGAGRGTIIEFGDLDATENIIENANTATGTGVVIRDMQLDGRDDINTGSIIQSAIALTNMGDGTGTTARQGATLTGLYFRRVVSNGIQLTTTDNSQISNNFFVDNDSTAFSTGIRSDGALTNVISNNSFFGNAIGYWMASTTNNASITGNIFQGNTTGLNVGGANQNSISGNEFQGNATGLSFSGTARRNSVVSNVFDSNTTAGLSMTSVATENSVSNNVFRDNGGATDNNSIVISSSSSSQNQIINNTIVDSACTSTCVAISIVASTARTYLEGNRITGSAANAASISDAGTNSVYVAQQVNTSLNTGDMTDLRIRGSGNSATAFAVQNASGSSVINIDTTDFEVEIGNTATSGELLIFDGTSNAVKLTASGIGTDYTLFLPTAAGGTSQCLQTDSVTASQLVFSACGSSDLNTTYGNDANGSDATITLSATDGSVIINNPTSSGTGSAFTLQVSQSNTTAGVSVLDLVQSSNAANGLNLTANSIDTENAFAVTANNLTTGHLIAANSSTTAFTGALAEITLSGSNAANTGSLLKLSNTGTASSSVGLFIDHRATGTNNLALRIDDVASDTTPLVVDGNGWLGIGTAAPTSALQVGSATNRGDATVYGSIVKKGITQQTGLTNIIDVFVYDTTRDSDGGDWTTAASSQVLSWYTETLDDGPGDTCNIATDDRCGRVNFPRKAVLVTTPSALYIFNSTDNSMFMKFTQSGTFALGVDTNNNPSGVFALNGVVYVGTNGTSGSGLYAIDFIKDRLFNYDATDRSQGDKNIANRNTTVTYNVDNRTSFALANSVVNDVHGQNIRGSQSTVSATSVPLNGVTFIVAATDASASLINMGSGKVLDYGDTTTDDINQVWLTSRGTLYLTNETLAQLERYNAVDVDTADQATPDDLFDEQATNLPNLAKTAPTISTSPDALQIIEGSSLAGESNVATINSADTIYVGHSQGLTEIDNVTTPSATVIGWSKFYSTSGQTGYMSGTPRGMFGFNDASGDITDATIRNNVLDVKNTPTYNVNGVHGTAVSFNGTNQYACSDANNDATCDTDADFDPGLISFTVEAWFKHATTVTGTDTLIDHTYTTAPALAPGFRISMNSSGQIVAGIDDDGVAFDDDIITSPAGTSYADGLWHHVLFERVSTATAAPVHGVGIYLYIDGRSVGSDTTIAATATLNGSAILAIGADCSVGAACGTGANFWDGVIDDVYISANGSTSSETLNALTGSIRRRFLEGKSALSKSATVMDNATTATSTTIGDSTATYSPNEFAGQIVEIYGGTGAGQTRRIVSNDTTTLTVTPAFSVTPDTTSDFRVAPESLYGATNSVTSIGITDNDFLGQSRTLYVGTSDGADGGGVSVFRGYGTTSRTEIYQSSAGITDDLGNSWTGTDADDIQSVEARSDTIVIGSQANLWIQRDDRTFEQSIDQLLNSLALTREELRVDGLQGISSEVAAFAGADLAENYGSDENLEAGEVVALKPNNVGKINRATAPYDSNLVGIVATSPGIVLGVDPENTYPVALVGRVPVKVSTKNGPIKSGDRLTSSDIPGYAMKANQAGRVLGTALEDFSEDKHILCADDIDPAIKCGTITVFVNLVDFGGEPVDLVLAAGESSGLTYDAEMFNPIVSLVDDAAADTKLTRASKILSYLSGRRAELNGQSQSEILTDEVNAGSVTTGDVFAQNVYTINFNVKDLRASRVSGLQSLEVIGDAEFKGNVWFKNLVTFVEKTVFNNDVTFKGRATFNSDTAGFAKIKKDESEVRVTFDKPYDQLPVVTVNAKNGQFVNYTYKDLNNEGFTIILQNPAAEDLEFAWTALSISDAKTAENPPPNQ